MPISPKVRRPRSPQKRITIRRIEVGCCRVGISSVSRVGELSLFRLSFSCFLFVAVLFNIAYWGYRYIEVAVVLPGPDANTEGYVSLSMYFDIIER